MPIRVLAPEVANQIAAGEVVERPASAVKELIENSLDSGATSLRVEVREGGHRLIRVQDDGCGIPADEASTAFLRHATSKISSTDDLSHITTLGFRGEALASIASVAQVTVQTRTSDADVGTFLHLAEGREVEHSLAGAPPGTTITVEHLFANVPARLKFLKQPATEAAYIQQVVTRYALAYPERRFSLLCDGKLLFQSTGTGKLVDVLARGYGLEMAKQMIPVGSTTDEATDPQRNARRTTSLQPESLVSEEEDSASSVAAKPVHPDVAGYASVPSLHRGNRGYITLFVNRRWFQDTSIVYAVIQAYHTLLPVGRYPVAVIFLEIDPGDVDVNVHPTKAEVRFREPNVIFSAVQKAVRRALAEYAPIPRADANATGTPGAWPHEARAATSFGGEGWAERRDAVLAAGRGAQVPMPLRHEAWGDASEGRTGGPTTGATIISPSPQPDRVSLMPILRVVGQLAATYIVAEGPDGMYLVDQHAAHERVLYEQMLADFTANKLVVQPLLEPAVLDLSPEHAAVVAEELETLAELGLTLEPFGGASYLLRSVPAVLARDGGQPERAVVEILDGLAQRDDVVEATHEARLVTLICKRAAIKGNTPMSLPEMQELVRRLEACRSPRTCPHGRPTMIYMSAAELAKQFGRP